MNASPNKGIEINMIDKEFPKLDVLKMIHTNNDPINAVNDADDALIEIGDDFGFTEYRYDFDDGRVFSPTKGTDL